MHLMLLILKKVEKEEIILTRELGKYLEEKVEIEKYTYAPNFIGGFYN